MSTPYYSDETVTLYHGDCLSVLREVPDASVHSVVTDPPAGVAFMGRNWDSDRGGRDRWINWLGQRMAQAFRVLKPGGYALVWALPRTSHWTAMALEDAGFQVRDCVVHLFGSGMPKSLDVGRAVKASTGTAGQWEGWGTALKPGQEIWWLARKPLPGTVAENVLTHGTGALNIDAGRISAGRWPTNLILTHSAACDTGPCASDCPAGELDRQSGITRSTGGEWRQRELTSRGYKGGGIGQRRSTDHDIVDGVTKPNYPGEGGASRYFPTFRYQAKAPRSERLTVDGVTHPTVKSLTLMRWLVSLVTPPGGLVCDPFLGSGTTAEAAVIEGFQCIGIERDATYLPLITTRLRRSVQPTLEAS